MCTGLCAIGNIADKATINLKMQTLMVKYKGIYVSSLQCRLLLSSPLTLNLKPGCGVFNVPALTPVCQMVDCGQTALITFLSVAISMF